MASVKKPILVVDDDPFILDIVSRYLERKGYRVLAITDPENAYRLAEKEQPQLMICDVAMPGLDGFSLFQQFKLQPTTKNIPWVLLTGSDKLKDIEKAFALGAQGYLIKPVDWTTAWPKIEPLLKE